MKHTSCREEMTFGREINVFDEMDMDCSFIKNTAIFHKNQEHMSGACGLTTSKITTLF